LLINRRILSLYVIHCNSCIIKIFSRSKGNKDDENHYPSDDTEIAADNRLLLKTGCCWRQVVAITAQAKLAY
jgi:hypothetical protein